MNRNELIFRLEGVSGLGLGIFYENRLVMLIGMYLGRIYRGREIKVVLEIIGEKYG